MNKDKRTAKLINEGYFGAREMYSPDCGITKLVMDVIKKYRHRDRLTFEEALMINKAGWEITYSGPKSVGLDLLDAKHI